MKKSRYRILSVLIAVIMVICAVPASVSAASTKALPSLSTSKYIKCYTLKSSGRIDAYTDSDLKTKKKNWYIDCSTDECWIVGVKDKAVKVSYPSQAKSGRSTAWFKRSDFTSTDISKKLSVMKTSKQITSYRRSDGKNEYGYAGKGDEIYKLQTSGKYTQIVYPLTGNNYKMGWVKTSELDKNSKDSNDSKDKKVESNLISQKLYQISDGKAHVLSPFDDKSYPNYPNWRHEGIDYTYKSGAAVHALYSGEVVRVEEGNSSSLSTIAIYNSKINKTIVYLHTDPINSLKVGQKINADQKIATEAGRGSATGAHTHIEIRDGKRTAAAISKDSKLLNTNTVSKWKNLGFDVGY